MCLSASTPADLNIALEKELPKVVNSKKLLKFNSEYYNRVVW